MGHIGDFEHPDVQSVIDDALARIQKAGRNAGSLATDDNVEQYLEAGVKFMLTNVGSWIQTGAANFLAKAGR